MGVEIIKDNKGKEHLVFENDDIHTDEPIGDKLEDYEYLQILGKGGFGRVAKVRCLINSKIYSMKEISLDEFISEEERRNCINEIEILKMLNHPNIIKYYQSFIENNSLYIITEFINNGDLSGYIKTYNDIKQRIPTSELWNIFKQCAEGLKYIHSNKIIHRDIKPANLFMTDNKVIKIGDFGLAALTTEKTNYQRRTMAGTPNYFSPEILSNEPYDNRTDIYSLGRTFDDLCHFKFKRTEKDKWAAMQGYEVMDDDDFEELNKSNYPEEMENIIKKMLDINKNTRPRAEDIYKIIKEQYIINYVQNTGINAAVRCLYSFREISQMFEKEYNRNLNKERPKIISTIFLECLKYLKKKDNLNFNLCLNQFREIYQDKCKISGSTEIDPQTILYFILEKIDQELTNKENIKNKFSLKLHVEEKLEENEDKAFLSVAEYYKDNFNSIISNCLVGFMRTKRLCWECQNKSYSFQMLNAVEFDMKKIKSNKLEEMFEEQQNHCVEIELKPNYSNICPKCKNKEAHQFEFKQFFINPRDIIICFHPDEKSEIKKEIEYPNKLNLSVGPKDAPQLFYLSGVIKRVKDDYNDYYISIYGDPEENEWRICKGGKVESIDDPHDDKGEGEILFLFYSSSPVNPFDD